MLDILNIQVSTAGVVDVVVVDAGVVVVAVVILESL